MSIPQADEQEETGAAASGVLSRYPGAIALSGGVAAAFGSSFIPMNAIEGFVTAYGIAELLPAAAPPLGDTARLALSAGIGTLTAGALLALLPRAESEDMGFETAIRKSEEAPKDQGQGIAPPARSGKLAGWLRTLRFGKADATPGTITDFSDLAAPRIRNGDQHPDAPVRAPIRASADLGAPLDTVETVMAEPAVAPLELGADMAFAPPLASAPAPSLRFAPPPPVEPMPEEALVEAEDAPEDALADAVQVEQPRIESVAAEPEFVQPAVDLHEPEPVALMTEPAHESDDDLVSLSTAELLARLESGLARRRVAATAARTANAVDEAGAQVLSLAKPAQPDIERTHTPFKFRLSDPQTVQPDAREGDTAPAPVQGHDTAAPVDPAVPARSIWDEEVEYLPPAISGMEGDAASVAAEPAPVSADSTTTGTPDDDMDAALRDALATLRQLSDRQRSS